MLRFSRALDQSPRLTWVIALMLTLAPSLFRAPRALAQRRSGEEETPVFKEYRGVQLGMTAEEARKKLGSPKDKSDEQDYFAISDNETAQLVYDKAHKVVTISADFLSGAKDVPTAKAVMGADVPPKPDGSVYKMVRYLKAGYWVSYFRGAGDAPLTTITIQKIDQ